MYTYIAFACFLYVTSYVAYLKISHGLGHKAEYLQLRRFFPCAVLAVLPMYLANLPLTFIPYIVSLIIGWFWIITYPLLYYFTYYKNSSDFGFHLDTVFGLYIVAWIMSLKILIAYFNIIPTFGIILISFIEYIIILIPISQWIYYALYKTCVDVSAITMMLETYTNEVLEFYKSLPIITRLLAPIIAIASLFMIILGNMQMQSINNISTYNLCIILGITVFLTIYLWNTKKGVFIRTGYIELVLDVKDYLKQTYQYKANMSQRIADLQITFKHPLKTPATYILIIGESASRDYMSAFCNYETNSTPWLNSVKTNKNFLLFPYAYACKDQTVPALELALTEANQYNSKKFYESCSIVDIARKAGFKISWFSNQSHIGSADTAVTLVANTSDRAEWTKLHLNQTQYDGTLLEYLKQIDAAENNFIVFHLKGSHFNFINRYPQNFAKFSSPNRYDLIPNYLDSIAYTDYILKQIKEYAQAHLNLQALVYFSDHATIPDKRRSPNFGGFATVRIPLFVYLSDEYIAKHSDIYNNLKNNQSNYWTNDLAYELITGILDIQSNHYDESNSLASDKYKYTKDMLTTNLGKLYIKDDK